MRHGTKIFVLTAAALALGACGMHGGTGDGTGGDAGTGTDGGGGGGGGFRSVALMDLDERVTDVYCTGAHACVVSTDPFGEAGHVYATDGHAITGTLITGDEAYADALHTLGTVSFLGFSKIGDRLVVSVDGAEDGFVSATGDYTQASSWSSVVIGNDPGLFGLNAQFGFGAAGGKTVLMAKGRIWESSDAPGTSATWTNIWSPQAIPPIPADIEDQRMVDATLCDTDPSVSVVPDLVAPIYVASDLSVIVTPASTVNQDGNDTAGVCISTDGGHAFHHAAFAGVDDGAGPTGVACTSRDHCVAYGGLPFNPGSAYVFVSTDASHGATSHWTRATTPTLAENTELRDAAFAPDGTHGWLVGNPGDSSPLLFATTDGGMTWTDATAMVRSLAPDTRLHSVYALDTTHVWIGGEHDTLLTTGD